MTDEPIKKCPSCGGPLKRLIGPGAGILFRGSGFYSTDYRSDSYKKAQKKEKAKADITKKCDCTPSCGDCKGPASE